MFNANFNSIFISAYSLPILSSPIHSKGIYYDHQQTRQAPSTALERVSLADARAGTYRRRYVTCVINEKVNTVF